MRFRFCFLTLPALVLIGSLLGGGRGFAATDNLSQPQYSRFGIDISRQHSQEEMLKQIPAAACAGFGVVRLPLDWNQVEPFQGKFNWQPYDQLVAAAKAQGLEVVFVLGPTASWASSAPDSEVGESRIWKMPRQWADWENYVRAAVSHYQGQVKYWQIWEGFDFAHFRATRSGMSALIGATKKAAKAANASSHRRKPVVKCKQK
jgi:beta-glucosidase/6-phospho-beta-glucosidase/beta-galactosidase